MALDTLPSHLPHCYRRLAALDQRVRTPGNPSGYRGASSGGSPLGEPREGPTLWPNEMTHVCVNDLRPREEREAGLARPGGPSRLSGSVAPALRGRVGFFLQRGRSAAETELRNGLHDPPSREQRNHRKRFATRATAGGLRAPLRAGIAPRICSSTQGACALTPPRWRPRGQPRQPLPWPYPS